MRKVACVFLAAFVQIFLLSLQPQNIIAHDYIAVTLTSVGISCTWIMSVGGVSQNRACKIAYTVGGTLGALLSMPFHDWIKTK